MTTSTLILDRWPLDIVDAICRWSDANNLPPLLTLGTLIQESGGDLDTYAEAHTPEEDSYGVPQINMRVPGRGRGEDYLGLDGMLRGLTLMRDRWVEAFESLGSWSAWIADVIGFQEQWAPRAQGSIMWSRELAALRFGEALRCYFVYLTQRSEG